MITRRTRIQLMVFVLITLLGVSYVGARYARLDRLFVRLLHRGRALPGLRRHLRRRRGVLPRASASARCRKLQLTDEGVDVHLDVDKSYDTIPADTLAVVGNRSAVGEQYVELQPQVDTAPYLAHDSEIAADDTRTPIATEKLLADIPTPSSRSTSEALQTTVTELGKAFGGTGEDLQRIIDTGNAFIKAANDNFDVTTALIKDSNTVLHGQVDSASAIRTFARDLALFSGTLAGSDQALREVIDNGSATAIQLRTFLEDNKVDLGELINNLVTTGDVVVKHLDGLAQILVIYPYVVEGGFTVVSKSPDTGLYDAHFGLVLTQDPRSASRATRAPTPRPPQDGSNAPMNMQAHCAEPPSVSNARGAQNAPRAGAAYRRPGRPSYDPDTGKLSGVARWTRLSARPATPAPATLGEESWKWLFLQPLMTQE